MEPTLDLSESLARRLGTPADKLVAWPGKPFPLGASWDGEGTNFAVWSPKATGVEVCLFDHGGVERRVRLAEQSFHIWHGYVPGVNPGQRYGYRVDGPNNPRNGDLFNPAKLLIDPYAKAIDGHFLDAPACYADNNQDSAPFVPRSVVVLDGFPWGGDRRPHTPWDDTIIYELHVRGFTQTHPDIPEELRGTYAGLAHPAAISYLKNLGVTAVELMPIHHFLDEPALQRRGLRNYWGYNSIGFFAPHAAYATHTGSLGGNQVREFKAMVRALHAAGIEVILDVVYNHTAEAEPDGPMLSFRGLSNPDYYRLNPDDRSRYLDYTGCGNTVDARIPTVLQLMMDSLRYWVTEMHVDGFRFDLASALARSLHDVDKLSSFFDTIHQDPVISQVKLIAEPWDVGDGGYQVGEFPPLWTEWNGKYRDTVRDFWAHGAGGVRDLAYRLTGSSDLYGDDGRLPFASINFVTAHDGFTLRDLATYERKHNEANGENNRDGTDDNRSVNFGVEGETADSTITTLRLQQVRAVMTTLVLSTGVPMITAGDERWRTQGGNNNAYCQDNPTSWIDWRDRDEVADLQTLTRRLIELRKQSPVLRQRAFFEGHPVNGGDGCKDLAWFHPAGKELDDGNWFDRSLRTVGMYLDGRGLRHRGPRGELIIDDSYLLLFHSGDDAIDFTVPALPWGTSYEVVVDTTEVGGLPASGEGSDLVDGGDTITLDARSVLVFRVHRS
ncbi:glycogen debranching protein GlgX [Jatrophihabitans telluris]|uniref:Glycogen debranching protein GlgX n=1 Tax=Jatrophihabitans telluris TaxID=2038343 RepID=A0ABY4R2A3_9ACTN|nr:glycogen debranching protein GlgX [Jatrophihabitans telluris]UQX89909.1 glycogen debranching protein GlgX [Jatrophihabitans telluris]